MCPIHENTELTSPCCDARVIDEYRCAKCKEACGEGECIECENEKEE